MRIAAALTVVLGCHGTSTVALDAAAVADVASDGTAVAPLKLGVVSDDGTVTCGAGALASSTCRHLTVDCSAATGAAALGVTVMISEPSGTAKGTIYLHNGSDGTVMASPQPDYVQAGFRTVALGWDAAWEDAPGVGILASACRPATVMKWAFDVPHAASRTAGFCAQGASAGSSAISYALAHYGMGAYLDYANLVSGPPMGRIDIGCAPSTYTGPARSVCAGANGALTDAPVAFAESFSQALINNGEHTSTCNSGTASSADLAAWAADSIVSPGATYDYPNTPVSFFYCTSATTNEVTGLGSFYVEQITSTKSVGCYTQCTDEAVGQDPAGKVAVAQSMLDGCIPRH